MLFKIRVKNAAVGRSNPGALFFGNLLLISTFMFAGVIVGISSSTAESITVVFEKQLVSSTVSNYDPKL